jgi:hypothetical protein
MLGLSGFHFKETMAGTWVRDGVERPISFSLTARASSWLQHLRDHKAAIDGLITMDGFATERPLTGEMTINPIFGGIIRYEFSFGADDGQRYRFDGQKDVTLLDPVGSMINLPATICDESSRPFATATLKFNPRDLPTFLASFRPSF